MEEMLTGEYHVENVLNRVGDEVTTTTCETGSLENVDDVVPAKYVILSTRTCRLFEQHVHHDVHPG